tara:strand:- start:57710 stop:58057 length:348 start_codon:yes stop_codon:yes gene_type:complete
MNKSKTTTAFGYHSTGSHSFAFGRRSAMINEEENRREIIENRDRIIDMFTTEEEKTDGKIRFSTVKPTGSVKLSPTSNPCLEIPLGDGFYTRDFSWMNEMLAENREKLIDSLLDE